jgi:hypothetical protein
LLILFLACVISSGLPDKTCTPGSINPKLTKAVICSKSFRTGPYRDAETSPTEKATAYRLYQVPKPAHNGTGKTQRCELDHLIPLQLGGADDLRNIWPQCRQGYAHWGPSGFHEKDRFENYLRRMVCSGEIPLEEAQREISTDWIRYWLEAGRPRS